MKMKIALFESFMLPRFFSLNLPCFTHKITSNFANLTIGISKYLLTPSLYHIQA